MSVQQAQYYLLLRDQQGNAVAQFDHWRYLRYIKKVNTSHQVQVDLGSKDNRKNLFLLDTQLEVYRRYAGGTWYIDCESLHRTSYQGETSTGRNFFTSYQRGYVDLLGRRVILGYAGTNYTDKNAPAETVMKEYVLEQCVSGAIYRDITNLTVEADNAQGTTVTTKKAWQNLLDVLQTLIDDVGGGDFDVIGTAPASFQFRFYIGQRGKDRRLTNTVGNPPVVFSLANGTLKEAAVNLNRMGEINAVYVGGQRQGSGRDVELRTNASAILDSPWNRMEAFRNASTESSTGGLQDVGDSALQEFQAIREYSFDIAQSPGLVYGRDYCVNGDIGDLVTIDFNNELIDKKIVQVNITVGRPEIINIEVADIPSV